MFPNSEKCFIKISSKIKSILDSDLSSIEKMKKISVWNILYGNSIIFVGLEWHCISSLILVR